MAIKMRAKRVGDCVNCRSGICVGEMILWDRRANRAWHEPDCKAARIREEERVAKRLQQDRCNAALRLFDERHDTYAVVPLPLPDEVRTRKYPLAETFLGPQVWLERLTDGRVVMFDSRKQLAYEVGADFDELLLRLHNHPARGQDGVVPHRPR